MAQQSTIDVSGLMGAFDTAHKSINATISDLNNALTQGTKLVGDEEVAIGNEASAANEIVRIDAATSLRKTAANKTAAAEAGLNPEASSYVRNAMLQDILATDRDLDARSTMLQKKADAKFLDDPIEWFTNQLSMPGDMYALEIGQKRQARKQEVLQRLQTETKEQIALNNAIDGNDAAVRADALEKQNLAAAAIKVAESQKFLIQTGMTGINIRMAANRQQFEETVQLNGALAQQQQLQLSRAHLGIAEKQLAIQTEMKNLQIEERKDNLEARQAMQKSINNASEVLGLRPISVAEFNHLTGQRKELYMQLMSDPNVQEGRAGYNAAQSLDVYNKLNAPGNPGVNLVRKVLTDVKNKVIDDTPDWKQKDAAQQNELVQKNIQARVRSEYGNIPEEGGIYSPGTLLSVLKIPEVAKIPIAADLVQLARVPDYKTSANDIFTVALDRIAKGTETPATVAAQIADIYKAINSDNNTQRQYNKLAIPIPVTHKTNLFFGFGWNSSQVVDMTNPAALETALTRAAVLKSRTGNAQELFGAPQ